MKKSNHPFYLTVTLLASLLIITACDEKSITQVEQPLRPVRTIVASATVGLTGRDFPGVVIAKNRADLSFRVSGKLEELSIKQGEVVEKGQMLARLDQTDFKIKLEDKQASYLKAEANFKRATKLVKPGHISQRDFDQIKATYSSATAHLKAAEQNLIYTELKAPFTGSITKIHVDNFEEVAGTGRIATLQDLTSMEIEIDIPESLVIGVRKNQEKQKIYASFDAIKGVRFPLTYREISTQADENTQAYKVRLALSEIENYIILPGMTATVSAEDNLGKNKIIIPAHAVLEDNKGRFVYIAEPEISSANTGIVHRRKVTTGQLTNSGLIITSGIDPTDRVITAGMSKMQENLRVRLMVNSELPGQ